MYSSPPASPTARSSRHRRTSSVASSGKAPSLYSHSRRSSQYATLSRQSSAFYGIDGVATNQSSTSINTYSGSPLGPGVGDDNGQENLADELAGAMEEDEGIDEEIDDSSTSQLDGSFQVQASSPPISPSKVGSERIRDSGIDVDIPVGPASTQIITSQTQYPSRPPKHTKTRSRTHSKKSSTSERYKAEGIETEDNISTSLEARLSDIETLARQGTIKGDTIEEEAHNSVAYFITSLKDLGGQQAGLESQATRLITAHTSLSMHLAYQSRSLQSLTYSLLSPLTSYTLPESEEYDADLISLLSSAIEAIPQPSFDALSGLHRLLSSSTELNSFLSSLSDNLHMSRQTTLTATRRLKSAKEIVAEIRKELRDSENGVKWIEDGHWSSKLERRECASVCKDVVDGFEEVCNGWRAQLESGAATEIGAA